MNVEQAIQFGLSKIKSDSARVDCEVLLGFVLKQNKTWLKTWPEFQLSDDQFALFRRIIERRATGEPVAYITGQREFWTLDLATNPSTLIPRPETELLVELALEFLNSVGEAKVLDLGTGTGAIALAIASERVDDTVLGADFNQDAVALAIENAQRNSILNAQFICSDWFQQIPPQQFDLIVSNPPYVAAGDPHLDTGDLVFEPDSALIAKDNGFADIQLIIQQAKSYLKPGGGLMFEHGFEQADQVTKLFENSGYVKLETVKDLAGLDRVTKGTFEG